MFEKFFLIYIALLSLLTLSGAELNFSPETMIYSPPRGRFALRESELEKNYLSKYISVTGNVLKLNRQEIGVELYCGGPFVPGKQQLRFVARSTGNENSQLNISVAMYPMHFREDNCSGKWMYTSAGKKSFTITSGGYREYVWDFNVPREKLLCSLDDHLLPHNRFTMTIKQGDTPSGLEIKDIKLVNSSRFALWKRKQVSGADWLADCLAADSKKKLVKDEAEEVVKAPEVNPVQKKVGKKPVVRKLQLKDVVSSIEEDIPAILSCSWNSKRDAIEVKTKPSGSSVWADIYLKLPDPGKRFYLCCSRQAEHFEFQTAAADGRALGSRWIVLGGRTRYYLILEPGCVKVRVRSGIAKQNNQLLITEIVENRPII